MKVKLLEIRDAGPVLIRILEVQISPKLAYRIRKMMNKLSDELKIIEETRIKLVNEKYGEEIQSIDEKDKKASKSKIVPEKNMEAFIKEWNDFLSTEIELDIQKIPFECLESNVSSKCPKCNTVIKEPFLISSIEMIALESFIEAPENENKNESGKQSNPIIKKEKKR